MLPTVYAMILKELIGERAPIVQIICEAFGSQKHLFDALVLKYPVALVVHPDSALATVNHVRVQVIIEFLIYQCDRNIRLRGCGLLKIFFGENVVRPKTFANGTQLVLFPLFVAIGTKFKIFGPFVQTVFTCLTGSALVALNTSFTVEINVGSRS